MAACSVCRTPVSRRYASAWCRRCEAWVLDAVPGLPPRVIDLRDPVPVRVKEYA